LHTWVFWRDFCKIFLLNHFCAKVLAQTPFPLSILLFVQTSESSFRVL
jgi:hypothetical protein